MSVKTTINDLNKAIASEMKQHSDLTTKGLVACMVASSKIAETVGIEHKTYPLDDTISLRDELCRAMVEGVRKGLSKEGMKSDQSTINDIVASDAFQTALNNQLLVKMSQAISAGKYALERKKEEMSGITRSNTPERVVRHASLEPETGRVKS